MVVPRPGFLQGVAPTAASSNAPLATPSLEEPQERAQPLRRGFRWHTLAAACPSTSQGVARGSTLIAAQDTDCHAASAKREEPVAARPKTAQKSTGGVSDGAHAPVAARGPRAEDGEQRPEFGRAAHLVETPPVASVDVDAVEPRRAKKPSSTACTQP